MAKQTILWTALPHGRTDRQLQLSVHIAPRLELDGGGTTTIDPTFGDFVDWPFTLDKIEFSAHFPTLGVTRPTTKTGVSADPVLWKAVFGPTTPVKSHQLPRLDDKIVHSYNVKHIVDFLEEQYSKFAVDSPEEYPRWSDLIADDGFGPAGFSARGMKKENGLERRLRLTKALDNEFLELDSDGRPRRAIPYNPELPQDASARADAIGKQFLQLEKFLSPRSKNTGKHPVKPAFDFHEALAFVMQHPGLMRLLGLVVDLTVDFSPAESTAGGEVRVIPVWRSAPAESAERGQVTPLTQYTLGPSVFEIRPKESSDFDRGHLQLGDESRFKVVQIDPDGGALKTMMLADNIQVAYPSLEESKKLSLTTPLNYSIASLRTAGFSIARLGLAPEFVKQLQAGTDLNAQAIPAAGAALPEFGPKVYLEDVVRGVRFDVLDGVQGTESIGWKTLMARVGKYIFVNLPGPREIVFKDEGTVIAAPTSAADGSSPDLYLQESMMRWDGWSLVASRPGKTLTIYDEMKPPKHELAAEFGLAILPFAKPKSLPRLRFGRRYSFRARAVDLAGNSVSFEQGANAADETLVTKPELFTRFEPVPQPAVLLRAPRIEGESPETVVIRSENGTALESAFTVGSSDRHLMPPRMSQLMGEHHGLFDSGTFGPMNAVTHADIAMLDKGTLKNHPGAMPEPGGPMDKVAGSPTFGQPETFFYPGETLALNYMPDLLARKAVFRGLPPDLSANVEVNFDSLSSDGRSSWPEYRPFRLSVIQGQTSGWRLSDGVLTVTLAKADVFKVWVSCGGLTDSDVALMGQWAWMQKRLQRLPGLLGAHLDRIKAGRHWMFTPARALTLVHAVRTPLAAPWFFDGLLYASKNINDTFATLGRGITFSRKSTSNIDVVGQWKMPVDFGPGKNPDPVTPVAFESLAVSLPVDRSKGPDFLNLDHRHEFGDTKFRLVSYRATATSAFTEFFTEHKEFQVSGVSTHVAPGLEASTVVARDVATEKTYRRGPEGDYTVDEAGGNISWAESTLPDGTKVAVDFVQPEIHAVSPSMIVTIDSSARPAAPKILYVVPTFGWGRSRDGLTSTRSGNGLRVYMERPWWSSGDGEKLGVVLWRPKAGDTDPDHDLAPYVTMWGLDPIYRSVPVAGNPQLTSFPLRISSLDTTVDLLEKPGITVDIAAHDVGFDKDRDLWYCDIVVNGGPSYSPFIRMALARYQRNSVPNAYLSPVVLADFMQLAPTRVASVVPLPAILGSRHYAVSVTGVGYTATKANNGPAKVFVTAERRIAAIADENLGWEAVGTPAELIRNLNSDTWRGEVGLPRNQAGPFRLVFEEKEVFSSGGFASQKGDARRVVYTDIINLP